MQEALQLVQDQLGEPMNQSVFRAYVRQILGDPDQIFDEYDAAFVAKKVVDYVLFLDIFVQ